MFKKFYFIVLLCIIQINGLLAFEDFQSKLKKYENEKNWDIKAEMLVDLCLESENVNYMRIKKHAKILLNIGYKLKNDYYINISSFVVGFILNKEGKVSQAMLLFNKNEDYFYKTLNMKNLAYVKIAKGHSYFYRSLFKEAILEYKKGKLIWQGMENALEVNLSESFIATSLIQMKQLEKAKTILKKCVAFVLPFKKNRTISSYYSQIGEIYGLQGNREKSQYYFDKGAEFAFKSKDPGTIARAQNYLAISKYYKGDVSGAIELFTSSLHFRQKSGDVKLVCESYYNIGSLYYEEKDFIKAEYFFKLSVDEAKKNGILQDQADAMLELSNLQKSKGDLKSALAYLTDYLNIKDKINNQFQVEMKKDYEVIDLLNYSSSQLESINRENKIDRKLKIEKRKNKLIILFSTIICSTLLLVNLLRKGKN